MAGDRAQGDLDQAKGIIKEKVGKVAGDRSTEVSGKVDQAKGKVEKAIGKAKDKVHRGAERTR